MSRWQERRRKVLADLEALCDTLEAAIEEARALPPAEPEAVPCEEQERNDGT